MNDARDAIYNHLQHSQLIQQQEANRFSADRILAEVFRYFLPKSVLDIGCGLGTWLASARDLGVQDLLGIEGNWLDRSLLQIPNDLIIEVDLEHPFDLGRRFELVISLEVAEHLSPSAASEFVRSLVRHADVVLFSAAIPCQGGHHHVNEQFLDYWSRLFEEHGYRPIDFLRQLIWNEPSVLIWLRQNVVIFAHDKMIEGPFAELADKGGPLSLVHPAIYRDRIQFLQNASLDLQKLLKLFSTGKRFEVVREDSGQLTVKRLE